MEFSRNAPILYAIVGVVIAFVLVQSVVFLIKAWKQGLKIGMTAQTLKKAVTSSAVFSLVPSLAILLALITLAGALGLALPWFRLSVIGAITYELPAAETALGAYGATIREAITRPEVFAAVAWVMTIGSITPQILIPLLFKKLRGGLDIIKKRDTKWMELFMAAMFVGMISAFLGPGISDDKTGAVLIVSVLTLLTSAATMLVLGLLVKRGVKWLENFALPISMLVGMGMAIVYTGWGL